MTQVDRVIKAARNHRGVCATDFLGPSTIDTGPPITRLAARIWEAQKRGYKFEVVGERDKCRVYRLVGETVAISDGEVAETRTEGMLDVETPDPCETTQSKPHWDESDEDGDGE